MSWFEIEFPVPARFSYRDESVEPDAGQWAVGNQVHGTRIALVDQPGRSIETDGLVTSTPGLTLGIRVADCAAVLLAHPGAGLSAAVHAGWRGAVGGIHVEVVRVMRELGADPDGIHVWVSPCIGRGAFEVGEEVAERFPDRFVRREGSGKPHVDLAGFIRDGLASCGIRPERLSVDGRCTVSDPGRFHSYRRDGVRSGRMWALITNGNPIS